MSHDLSRAPSQIPTGSSLLSTKLLQMNPLIDFLPRRGPLGCVHYSIKHGLEGAWYGDEGLYDGKIIKSIELYQLRYLYTFCSMHVNAIA